MHTKQTDISHAAMSARFVAAYNHLTASGVVTSKRRFCLAIGMQPQNFHPIETGERFASVDMLCALVNAYDINPTWLFVGSGEMCL